MSCLDKHGIMKLEQYRNTIVETVRLFPKQCVNRTLDASGSERFEIDTLDHTIAIELLSQTSSGPCVIVTDAKGSQPPETVNLEMIQDLAETFLSRHMLYSILHCIVPYLPPCNMRPLSYDSVCIDKLDDRNGDEFTLQIPNKCFTTLTTTDKKSSWTIICKPNGQVLILDKPRGNEQCRGSAEECIEWIVNDYNSREQTLEQIQQQVQEQLEQAWTDLQTESLQTDSERNENVRLPQQGHQVQRALDKMKQTTVTMQLRCML